MTFVSSRDALSPLDGRYREPLSEGETHARHPLVLCHPVREIGGNVSSVYRSEMHAETRLFRYRVSGNSGRAQLRQHKIPMVHDAREPGFPETMDEFIRAERSLPGRAPDVDSFRIEHEYPYADAIQFPAEQIERELVVRRDEDGRCPVGFAAGVQPWLHAVVVPPDVPSNAQIAESVSEGQSGCRFPPGDFSGGICFYRRECYVRSQHVFSPSFFRVSRSASARIATLSMICRCFSSGMMSKTLI
jgi:hypothetical protein